MGDLGVSFTWNIVKTSYNHCNFVLAYKMLIEITYLFCQNCSKLMKMTKTLMSIFSRGP